MSFFSGAPEDNPGIIEHIIMAIYSVFQLIVNSSYLATNIIMMVRKIINGKPFLFNVEIKITKLRLNCLLDLEHNVSQLDNFCVTNVGSHTLDGA